MSKHTPGPWKIGSSVVAGTTTRDDYDQKKKVPYLIGGLSIYTTGMDTICHISWDEYDKTEKEANAALIAAAPDLMEVCKYMINSSNLWIPRMVSEEFEDEARVLHSLRQRILSAIIKAEGKP
jgi:hypothetical protein